MFNYGDLAKQITKLANALKSARRDKREPRRKEKEDLQIAIERAIMRHFSKQKTALLDRLRYAKALPDIDDLFDDWDGEIEHEIIRLLMRGARGGVRSVADLVSFYVDFTSPNTQAAEWARRYAGALVKEIDKASLDAVRSATAVFIETPGFTLQDLADMLPFSETRSFTIAVTETTRAYSQGQQIARDDLMAKWPDVKIIGTWFTNSDDIVCELCGQMDGREVEGDDTFYDPEDDYQDGFPPLHPNCRCWVDWRTKING